MLDIAVVGSLNIDLMVRTPRFPRAGETVLGSMFQSIPGGKGANQAVAARRLGADVSMIGRIGEDKFGKSLQENLQREGIDTSNLRVDGSGTTGVALISVDERGENTIIVVPGANANVSTADVEAASLVISRASILLLQLEIPVESVLQAARIARRTGVTTILNAAPARSLPSELLSLVDYLVVNETEATQVVGIGAMSPPDVAKILQSLGARNVVITLGTEGVVLVQVDGSSLSLPAFQVQAIDTTAAGDAFVGAFAVALGTGLANRDALLWGSAAGALTVTREGAQPSLPHRSELEEFLRSRQSEV
jgi:ribokinase